MIKSRPHIALNHILLLPSVCSFRVYPDKSTKPKPELRPEDGFRQSVAHRDRGGEVTLFLFYRVTCPIYPPQATSALGGVSLCPWTKAQSPKHQADRLWSSSHCHILGHDPSPPDDSAHHQDSKLRLLAFNWCAKNTGGRQAAFCFWTLIFSVI